MVSVKLQGGLGNQLFQIFTCIAYSLTHKVSFRLPLEKEDKTSAKGDLRPTYWKSLLSRLIPFLSSDRNIYFPNVIFYQQGFHYSPIPTNIDPDTQFIGYFQSDKYFDHQRENILKMLNINEIQEKIKERFHMYFDQENTTVISMHFRLGDYKHLSGFHDVIPLEYYKKALDYMLEKIDGNVRVILFGEKQDEHILKGNKEELERYTENKNIEFIQCGFDIHDYDQMILMSLCDHNIIANSSFSWFGAYLNENKEKMVTYTRKWFGDRLSGYKLDDLWPETWKCIEY